VEVKRFEHHMQSIPLSTLSVIQKPSKCSLPPVRADPAGDPSPSLVALHEKAMGLLSALTTRLPGTAAEPRPRESPTLRSCHFPIVLM